MYNAQPIIRSKTALISRQQIPIRNNLLDASIWLAVSVALPGIISLWIIPIYPMGANMIRINDPNPTINDALRIEISMFLIVIIISPLFVRFDLSLLF